MNISKAVESQVNEFHNRQLSDKYVVIFMDTTYLNVRRTENEEEAKTALQEFLNKHGKQYPKIAVIFERAEDSLFSSYNKYKFKVNEHFRCLTRSRSLRRMPCELIRAFMPLKVLEMSSINTGQGKTVYTKYLIQSDITGGSYDEENIDICFVNNNGCIINSM